MHATDASEARWLLLIHQIPPQPAYLRVKTRRRLQQLGAAPIEQTVYALPRSTQAQEDFAWLRGEIVAGGGEAFICSAGFLGGLSDGEVERLFVDAREPDYLAIAEEGQALRDSLGVGSGDEAVGQLRKLQRRRGTAGPLTRAVRGPVRLLQLTRGGPWEDQEECT